jgi:hypothetical protein
MRADARSPGDNPPVRIVAKSPNDPSQVPPDGALFPLIVAMAAVPIEHGLISPGGLGSSISRTPFGISALSRNSQAAFGAHRGNFPAARPSRCHASVCAGMPAEMSGLAGHGWIWSLDGWGFITSDLIVIPTAPYPQN